MELMKLLASTMGQEEFIDLLGDLPDGFFSLDEAAKHEVWKLLLYGYNRGLRGESLARLAVVFVKELSLI